jgi:hypothetical protein
MQIKLNPPFALHETGGGCNNEDRISLRGCLHGACRRQPDLSPPQTGKPTGIRYKSADHSYVNELVRARIIMPEEAATHPKRNIITRDTDDSVKMEAIHAACRGRSRDHFSAYLMPVAGVTGKPTGATEEKNLTYANEPIKNQR